MIRANEIYCGNCVDVMKEIKDETIDLVVTSPPYDNLRKYQGYIFDFEGVVEQLFRILKVGGVVVWVRGDATINGSETGTSFRQAIGFMDFGFKLHDTMIFHKTNPIPLTHNRYEQYFEYMFVFGKDKPKTFNPIMVKTLYEGEVKRQNYSNASSKEQKSAMRREDGGTRSWAVKGQKIKGNIWSYKIGQGISYDKLASKHPAVFPEQLVHDHIISWSNEGDTVLDPMCGSGTTLKVAKLLGRNFIGIDISPEYCELSRQRVN